jgi:hypothetical protein
MPHVISQGPLAHLTAAPQQFETVLSNLQSMRQSCSSGQLMVAFLQLDAAVHRTLQAKPGGQFSILPSHSLAMVQSMWQVLLAQPPSHTGGHTPPRGGTGSPQSWLPPFPPEPVAPPSPPVAAPPSPPVAAPPALPTVAVPPVPPWLPVGAAAPPVLVEPVEDELVVVEGAPVLKSPPHDAIRMHVASRIHPAYRV